MTEALRDSAPAFVAEFSESGALRQPVGTSGRVHLDRWLPFLVLHRSAEPLTSLARRVATDSPAYLVWSPDEDGLALAALAAIVTRLVEHAGQLLVVTIDDQPVEPRDEAFGGASPICRAYRRAGRWAGEARGRCARKGIRQP